MWRSVAIGSVSLAIAACGRLGFDPVIDATGPGDPSALLKSITLWAAPGAPLAAPMSPAFAPEIASYGIDVGLAMSSVRISAEPVDSTTTIMIEGAAADPGELSAAVALGLGTTQLVVVGTGAGGGRARYTIDVTRAAALAQVAYAKASNTDTGDGFGVSIAISGDTLAVGALGEDSNATGVDGNAADNSASSSGAVYVFTREAGMWSQQAYLKASNPDIFDGFGVSVAVSGDTIAVSAIGEGSRATGVGGNQADNTAGVSGAVYVFTREGGVWSQQAYVKASNTEASDDFGASVALSGDTLAVGANVEASNATGVGGNQADNSAASSGAVYVFTRTAGVWSQQAYVKASNTGTGDQFGDSVALSGDTLAVGAPFEASNAIGIGGNQADNSAAQSGAVYLFTREGGVWSQQAYVKASNTGAIDSFGVSVALSGDTLAVGASRESSNATGVGGNQADNTATDSGAIYVFTRAAGAWSQQAYVKASNTETGDQFGYSVAVSGDTLVAGAVFESSSATGIGGNQADNAAAQSGAVYVFTRTAGVWSQQAYVKASNAETSDQFGYSVAVSGDTFAAAGYQEASRATGVGGNQADNTAGQSGAVYVFR